MPQSHLSDDDIRILRNRTVSLNDVYTPEQYGAVGDDATDDTNAINRATADAISNGGVLLMGPRTYRTTGTWNCTPGPGGVGSAPYGLRIKGYGYFGGKSRIRHVPGTNNLPGTVGWDLIGMSDVVCDDFAFINGTSVTNCAETAILVGDGTVTGGDLMQSVGHTFRNSIITGYGTYTYYNNGLEESVYHNCRVSHYRTSGYACTYVGSGSAPQVTSPNVTIRNPCPSMSQVWWRGGNSGIQWYGDGAVRFRISAAGGVSMIRHDGYHSVASTVANTKFMSDDSAGIAGSGVNYVGGEDIAIEALAANTSIVIADFEAAACLGHRFTGTVGTTSNLTVPQFVYDGTLGISEIDWDPNSGTGNHTGNIITVAGNDSACRFRVRGARSRISLSGTSTSIRQGTDDIRLPPVASFTVAGLPSAVQAAQLIYVSNEVGGAVLAFSDGVNWRRVTDRAIVA